MAKKLERLLQVCLLFVVLPGALFIGPDPEPGGWVGVGSDLCSDIGPDPEPVGLPVG